MLGGGPNPDIPGGGPLIIEFYFFKGGDIEELLGILIDKLSSVDKEGLLWTEVAFSCVNYLSLSSFSFCYNWDILSDCYKLIYSSLLF